MTTPSLTDLHVSNPTHQTQQNRISNITYLSGSGGVTENKYHASAKLGPYSTNTVREKKLTRSDERSGEQVRRHGQSIRLLSMWVQF